MNHYRPHLLLLVLDTQRADHLGCYGYPFNTSPHLDKLAAEATRFAYPVAPAQWTAPTHASLFTGLYPSQHTVYQMDSVLPAELATLAERLQRVGYRTAGFSHNPLVGLVQNGLQRGFDQFTNYHDIAAGLLAFQFNPPKEPANVFGRVRRGLRLAAAELLGYSQRTLLHWLAPLTQPVWQKGLDLVQQSKTGQTRRALMAVARLLGEQQEGQPVFAFINLMGVHVPYDPARWTVEQFMADLAKDKPAGYYLQQANQWQVDVGNWLESEMEEDTYRAIVNACYNAEVAAQDAQIGWLIEQLRANGALDHTFLVIVADHGDHLGERRRLNHMFGVYQLLVHVPLLIRDPFGRLVAGEVVEPFISTRRVFHTLLAAAEAATAEEKQLALWEGERPERFVFSEGYPLQWAIQRIEKNRPGVVQRAGYDQLVRAVYGEEYKLVAWDGRQELYAIRTDPQEITDLSQQLPEQVAELQSQLNQFGEQTRPATTLVQREEDDPAVLQHLRHLGYIE
jgi:arylsulfatase A-like enzyme